MIIQIDIPDDAIKQENIENEDIVNIIECGIYYMFKDYNKYNIANSDIKVSIK